MARRNGGALPAPVLPEPIDCDYRPFVIEGEGTGLVLSDVHIPFHDVPTVEGALKSARAANVHWVLLNGDILDSHQLSTFDRTPDDPRYATEIRMGLQFLAYVRYRLPRARIVWKDGNHEERLWRYLVNRAPELFGLEQLSLPSLLQMSNFGVEYVSERRVVTAGKLSIVHGHEYRPSISCPVNPARGLFLRAKSVALCGHWHQTSEHHEPDIRGKPQGTWSVGCACGLRPRYNPLNKWNHGFALVEVDGAGAFSVRNMRVMNGEVV